MKRKIRIVLVFILSFTMTISMGISAYASGTDESGGGIISIEEEEKTEEPKGTEELTNDIPEVSEEEPEATEEDPEVAEDEPEVTEDEPEEPEVTEDEPVVTEEDPVESQLPIVPVEPVIPEEAVEVVAEIFYKTVVLSAEVILNDKVSNGDILNYEIILNNSGDVDISKLSISDDLGINTQIANLVSSGKETIRGSLEIDRFNELEQIENRIAITGQVDGRQVDLSLAFIAEVEIVKGTLKISIDEKQKNTGQVFDVFIKGEESGLYTLSIEAGKEKTLDNLWPDKYTIKTITPMNYEPIEDILVDLTQENLDKPVEIGQNRNNSTGSSNKVLEELVKIEQGRNNSRWFSNQDTEFIQGETIAARKSMFTTNNYKVAIEEKRFDEVSFEIEVAVVVEAQVLEPVTPEPIVEDSVIPTTPEVSTDSEIPEIPEVPDEQEEPEQPTEPVETEQEEGVIPDDPLEESNDGGDEEHIDEKTKEPDKATEPEEIAPPKDPEEKPIISD